MAAWAELLEAQEACHMLTSAQQAYEAALAQESDAAVCTHLYACMYQNPLCDVAPELALPATLTCGVDCKFGARSSCVEGLHQQPVRLQVPTQLTCMPWCLTGCQPRQHRKLLQQASSLDHTIRSLVHSRCDKPCSCIHWLRLVGLNWLMSCRHGETGQMPLCAKLS